LENSGRRLRICVGCRGGPGRATRRTWLGSLTFEHVGQQQALADLPARAGPRRPAHRSARRDLDAAAKDGSWASLVARLRCLCGIDTLTSFGLVAEIATDWSRFKSAEQFMSYVGLAPSQCSSEQSRRQGPITKAGNAHVRRLLAEAARQQRQRPRVGAALATRQRAQDPLVLERASRAQQRSHRR
jgi:transposase